MLANLSLYAKTLAPGHLLDLRVTGENLIGDSFEQTLDDHDGTAAVSSNI